MRGRLLAIVAHIEPCTNAIEARTGTLAWQEEFERRGHNAKIVSPQCGKLSSMRGLLLDGGVAVAKSIAIRHLDD